ncbi:hypothetical protein A1O1_08770 [Capronia coronata CBS 617.96]|uniref:Uncharacterized protein n=1 Tax=Capronia coronata CBS 617.96 TaxID=1182541 RepID=W9XR98_9EURO|nr:uncharacterized protein A1O1_08770 [Capronia coronata CBS 617.96]EXJ79506.1 hypothetical protein A1O1_08770 [Capronia coronata CBS 617.96]
MDHLPLLKDSDFPPLEVEYLGRNEQSVLHYDNHGFTDFPTRAGWNKQDLFDGPRISQPSRTVAAFIQQWLYFGLLSAFLNHGYSMHTLLEAFTRLSGTSDQWIITTHRIEQ